MRLTVIISTLVISGCIYFTSWDELGQGWVGRDISEITNLWGEPDTVTKENRHDIYRYHLKDLDPSCIHFWIVDKNGVIKGFRYEGYCSPIG